MGGGKARRRPDAVGRGVLPELALGGVVAVVGRVELAADVCELERAKRGQRLAKGGGLGAELVSVFFSGSVN